MNPIPNFALKPPSSAEQENLAIGTTIDFAGSPPQFTAMVNSACVSIFERWLPHVGAAAARAEAESFGRRFHHLIDGPLAPLTEPELDAVLDCVADAMAAP